VNCAQALLQIVYWWHPLLWFANARIRRVREEAVDDAVMLALNEDAETYAPTLLEVAKLALHRPLASLGLVGILESRSSLRQRIERLMDFHPPRHTGLTLGSAVAVLGFAALAVPMGEPPAPSEAPQAVGSSAVTNASASSGSSHRGLHLDPKLRVSRLVHDGKLLYEMNRLDAAEAKLKEAIKLDPQNQAAAYYLNLVDEARFIAAGGDPRELLPMPNPYARTNSIRVRAGRQDIIHKLGSIRLDRVSYDGLPLSEVLRSLTDEAQKRDPDKLGVNFIIASRELAQTPWETGLDSLTTSPKPARPAEAVDTSSIVITLKYPLTNIRLGDVLDAVVKTASQPLKYSIEDYAVVFSLKRHEAIPLYVRTFKVDPNTLLENLHLAKRPGGTNVPVAIATALRDRLSKEGVDLDPVKNPGKAIFYTHREGMLTVRTTLQDLEIIERQIAVLNTVPPQINIKCKFVEIPLDDNKNSGWNWNLGNMLMSNAVAGGQPGDATNSASPLLIPGSGNPSTSPFTLNGILTDPQYRVVIKALQQRSGAEILAQPEVTTTSGRQAQMKAVDVKTVVTGIDKRALTPPGITTTNGDESSLYKTEQMEFGPTLDVTASVLADGYTIALTVLPTVIEFRGYEGDRTNRVAVYVNGKKKWVFPPVPNFQLIQMNTDVRVWDGQTVVLRGMALSETVTTIKDQVPMLGDLPLLGRLFRSESKATIKKNLLVFITPTLIDPAGNRIHSEQQMPPGRSGIPPQPAR
jgi:tetratricopeptide (TPR) repeat protein